MERLVNKIDLVPTDNRSVDRVWEWNDTFLCCL